MRSARVLQHRATRVEMQISKKLCLHILALKRA
jgi:hypothetical protein